MKREQRNNFGYLVDPSKLESMQQVAARIFLKERVGAQDSNFNQFSSYLQDSGSMNHFLIFTLFLLPRNAAAYESDMIHGHNPGKMFLQDKKFRDTFLGMKLAHCKKKHRKKQFAQIAQNEAISRSEIQFTEVQAAMWIMLLHSEMIARQRFFCSQQSDFFNSIHATQRADFAKNEETARCRLYQSALGRLGSLPQQFHDECKAIKLQEQIRLFQETCARYYEPLNTLRQTLQSAIDDEEAAIALKFSAISAATLLQTSIIFFEEIMSVQSSQPSVLLSVYGACCAVRNLTQFKKNVDSLAGRDRMPAILCEIMKSDSFKRLLCEPVFQQLTLFRDAPRLDQLIFALAHVYYFYAYMVVAVNLLKFFLPPSFIALITVQKERLTALISKLFQCYDTNVGAAVKKITKIADNGAVRADVERILQGLEATKTMPVIQQVADDLFPHPVVLAFYNSLLQNELFPVITALKSVRDAIFLSKKTTLATSTTPVPRVR